MPASAGMTLHYLHRDPGAGFGVGEGVVVTGEVEAAGGGYGMQLMIRETAAETAP